MPSYPFISIFVVAQGNSMLSHYLPIFCRLTICISISIPEYPIIISHSIPTKFQITTFPWKSPCFLGDIPIPRKIHQGPPVATSTHWKKMSGPCEVPCTWGWRGFMARSWCSFTASQLMNLGDFPLER